MFSPTFGASRALAAMLRLAVSLLFASAASAQTTLYAEALGATGAYSVGVQQNVLSSDGGDRRLTVRIGASYRTDRLFSLGPDNQAPIDHVLAIPVAVAATFGLGQQRGVPLSAEFGAGAVFVRRGSERFEGLGESFALPRFAEALLGAQPSDRVAVRLGALIGGARSADGASNVLGFEWQVQPILRAGVSL